MVKQKKRTRITQSGKNCLIKLRHPRRALDLKAKDLIGSFKKRIVYYQKPVQRRNVFMCVLYFGWPNQPSSGTMKIMHWNVIFLLQILVKPEIRKND